MSNKKVTRPEMKPIEIDNVVDIKKVTGLEIGYHLPRQTSIVGVKNGMFPICSPGLRALWPLDLRAPVRGGKNFRIHFSELKTAKRSAKCFHPKGSRMRKWFHMFHVFDFTMHLEYVNHFSICAMSFFHEITAVHH